MVVMIIIICLCYVFLYFQVLMLLRYHFEYVLLALPDSSSPATWGQAPAGGGYGSEYHGNYSVSNRKLIRMQYCKLFSTLAYSDNLHVHVWDRKNWFVYSGCLLLMVGPHRIVNCFQSP